MVMGPQAQPLHTLWQVVDGMDVVVGQLKVLDVGQAKLLGPPPQARDRASSSTIGASSSTPVVRGGVSSSVVREDQIARPSARLFYYRVDPSFQ